MSNKKYSFETLQVHAGQEIRIRQQTQEQYLFMQQHHTYLKTVQQVQADLLLQSLATFIQD